MKTLLVSALAISLAGTALIAQTTPAREASASSSPSPVKAMPFVAKAGASDLYEIQSSQLAEKQGKSAKVKSFAAMMIEHHMMTTKEVVAAARAAGLAPAPPALEPAQAAMIAELRPLSGAAFDRAYLTQQKKAHAMALELHQTYASDGDMLQLKAAANKAVPIVQHHIAELESM